MHKKLLSVKRFDDGKKAQNIENRRGSIPSISYKSVKTEESIESGTTLSSQKSQKSQKYEKFDKYEKSESRFESTVVSESLDKYEIYQGGKHRSKETGRIWRDAYYSECGREFDTNTIGALIHAAYYHGGIYFKRPFSDASQVRFVYRMYRLIMSYDPFEVEVCTKQFKQKLLKHCDVSARWFLPSGNSSSLQINSRLDLNPIVGLVEDLKREITNDCLLLFGDVCRKSFLRCQVRSKTIVNFDCVRIIIDLPSGYEAGLLPGQSIIISHTPPPASQPGFWNRHKDLELTSSGEVRRHYTPLRAGIGVKSLEILVKCYLPNPEYVDGGKLSRTLRLVKANDYLKLQPGPLTNVFSGKGRFLIGKKVYRGKRRIGIIVGGSAVTLAVQLSRAIIADAKIFSGCYKSINMLISQKNPRDVILKEEMEEFVRTDDSIIKTHLAVYISNPPKIGTLGAKGYINRQSIVKGMPKPGGDVFVVYCGPDKFCTTIRVLLESMDYESCKW